MGPLLGFRAHSDVLLDAGTSLKPEPHSGPTGGNWLDEGARVAGSHLRLLTLIIWVNHDGTDDGFPANSLLTRFTR